MTQRAKFGPVIGLLAVYAVVLTFAVGAGRHVETLGDEARPSQADVRSAPLDR